MKTTGKHTLILIALIVFLGGAYGGFKEWTGASRKDSQPLIEPAGDILYDLTASLNIQQPKKPITSPDFRLKSLDGQEIKLSQFRGKIVLISFWATW